MFYEQRTTVPGTVGELRAEYESELAALVEGVGVEAAAAETGVDAGRLETLLEGDSPPLDVEEAAAIVALGEGEPDAATAVEIACEHLLLGMATAVLDVDAVADELALGLDPKEIQQKVERRAPMSFEEFVHLQYVIASRTP